RRQTGRMAGLQQLNLLASDFRADAASRLNLLILRVRNHQIMQRLMIDGKPVDTVGIPCHWGFEGTTRKGFLANTLTPSVG
ncbi:hypothetical protein HZD82_24740, partial [Pantoea agglomerans]|nr:hypothetical protein [Pantoea agglomerans]